LKRPATKIQVSAGGVAFRREEGHVQVAIVLAGGERWQLPKGLVGRGETTEEAAVREVREEAGVEAEIVRPIDTVEYWYWSAGRRVRFHKYVYFFLMQYLSGDVRDHDDEVEEARWVDVGAAPGMLAFESEREVVRRAEALIEAKERAGKSRGAA
jgi:8-oxo-dGTP pyrophosphatase MutT (NUDIX family)